ncbi:MAG TPA: hypothetical protein VGL31_09185 [Xanthobacteraceae bacterium]
MREHRGWKQFSDRDPICDRSHDRAGDQDKQRSAQIAAMPSAPERKLKTLARARRRHLERRRLAPARRTFSAHGGNPGYRRQLGGARKRNPAFRGATPGIGSNGQGLASQPRNAGLESLKVAIAGRLGNKIVSCACLPALARQRGSQMIGIRARRIS